MAPRPNIPRPSTFKVGKRSFACGLYWNLLDRKFKRSEALKRVSAEVRKAGGPSLDLAVVHVVGSAGTLQAGFAARSSSLGNSTFSAAALAARFLGNDFIAALPLDGRSGKCVFVSCRQGAVLPQNDELLPIEEAKARFLELVAAMADDDVRKICPDTFNVPGSEEITFEQLVERSTSRLKGDLQLSPLSPALMIRDRLPLIVGLSVLIGGVWGWTEYQDYQDAKVRARAQAIAAAEAARLAELQATAAQPVRSTERPWVKKPLPREFVALCGDVVMALPLALDGWEISTAACDGAAVTATYNRVAPATLDQAIESAGLFRLPEPTFDDPGNIASVQVPLSPLRPGGEDPLAPYLDARYRLVALLQGVNAQFALSDVPDPPPPPLPPGHQGEPPPPPPPPPWRSMRFEVTAGQPIAQAAPSLLGLPGLRVTGMTVTRSGSELSFTTTGELHAIR